MHKGRKTPNWGDSYTCIVDLVVQNGVISVEGLLSKDDFCSKDKETIEEYVRLLEYDFYMTCHYINGQIVTVKNWVNELVEA